MAFDMRVLQAWVRQWVAGWVNTHFVRKLQYENEVVKLTGDQEVGGVKTFSDGLSFGDETLANYDEGNWTPVAAGVTLTTATGDYTRVGRIVVLSAELKWPATADTTPIAITGLPFAAKNNFINGGFIARSDYSALNARVSIDVNEQIRIRKPDDSGGLTNADVSGKFFNLTLIYIAA